MIIETYFAFLLVFHIFVFVNVKNADLHTEPIATVLQSLNERLKGRKESSVALACAAWALRATKAKTEKENSAMKKRGEKTGNHLEDEKDQKMADMR